MRSIRTATHAPSFAPLARRLCAGFLAGASGVLGLLAGVALLLAVGGIWPLLYDIASGLRGDLPFWPTLAQGVAQSFGNLPTFFWSARWAIVLLGLVGLALALVESMAARVARPWRHLLGPIALLGLVGTVVFALQYTYRENLLAWVAAQPWLASLQESALVSDVAALSLGVVIALPTAYVIWLVWSWWDLRWQGWLGLRAAATTQATMTQTAPAAPAEDWRTYQERLHRLKRGAPAPPAPPAEAAPTVPAAPQSDRLLAWLLGLIAVATIVLLGSIWLYNLSGSRLGSGNMFVSRQSPVDLANLEFGRAPRQVIVAGISGAGSVEIAIGRPEQSTPIRPVAQLPLLGAGVAPPVAAFDLAGLEPGRYWLKIGLREGDGGQVRYTVLQGGGLWAQVAGWAIGLAAGIWLALGALIVCEVLARRGWFRAKTV